MATTTSITSTYAGEFAGKYISAALLSANTIDKGGIEVMPNIKYKSTMKKVATHACSRSNDPSGGNVSTKRRTSAIARKSAKF